MALDFGIDIPNPAGLTLVDFNTDGKADIVVGQTNVRNKKIKPTVFFLKNQLRKNYYLFYLQGVKSNRDGIGAKLEFSTNQRKFIRWFKHQRGGLPNQSEPMINIALKNREALKRVKVTWPYKKTNGQKIKKTYNFTKTKPGIYTLCESGKRKLNRGNCIN